MLSEKIREKYQKTAFTTVKEWKDSSKCPLSLETMTSVVNRGKEPSIPAFIQMAYCLGVPAHEIAVTCKAAGDDIFWRLIEPASGTEEEQAVIDKILALDTPAKKKLVLDLLKALED